MKCLFTLLLFSSFAFAQAPYFVENQGQWDAPFSFKMSGGGAIWYVTSTGMTIDFRQYERQASARSRDPMDEFMNGQEPGPVSVRGHVLKMNFVNANPSPSIYGEDLLSHYSNYFLGRDSCNWRGHVPHYQKVVMKEVWPGIDVELVAQREGVETVCRVAPFADLSQIQIEYEGLDAPLSVDANGNLILLTSLGTAREKAPWAYQKDGHVQKNVETHYKTLSASSYTLLVPRYDWQKELVIDPLLYGSYLGGSGPDEAWDIEVTDEGVVIVGGTTESSNFPVTPGVYQEERVWAEGFVTVFSHYGDSIRFSSYLGSGDFEATSLRAVCANNDDAVYAAGATTSDNWPRSEDAFDTVFAGNNEGFLTRLSPDGAQLEYSSYLGGAGVEFLSNVQLAGDGYLYVCGQAGSSDFPVTPDGLFQEFGGFFDGFLAAFSPTASALSYCTFIPGNSREQPESMKVMLDGRIWIVGDTRSADFPVTPDAVQPSHSQDNDREDGFVCLWDLSINELIYSSFLGGNAIDRIFDMTSIDSTHIVLTGHTESTDFPVTVDVFDTAHTNDKAFVTIIELPQTTLHSTLLGGSQYSSYSFGVHADSLGVVAAGFTYSHDFPVTADAFDSVFNANGQPSEDLTDAFISRFSPDLSTLVYSTYFGGWHVDRVNAVTFEANGTVWIAGETGSNDLPITDNAFQDEYVAAGDGFLTRFSIDDTTTDASPNSPTIPQDISLSVYPNPFNPTATLSFTLPHREFTFLRLYDLLGRIVQEQDLGWQAAGEHAITIDAQSLPSGTYITQLQAGPHHLNRKLILLR